MGGNFEDGSDPRRARRWRAIVIGLIVVFVLVVVGGTIGAVAYWRANFQTYHLAMVQPGILYRDGNRDVREFANAVRHVRPRTVVSVVEDREVEDASKPQFREEASFCKTHGIKQVRIPVKLGGWPSSGDVRQFLKVMGEPDNYPVLVHCAQGVRRTGMFVAAYEESVLGWSPQQAKAKIVAFGHGKQTIADVERFIDSYHPKSQTVGMMATTRAATTRAAALRAAATRG